MLHMFNINKKATALEKWNWSWMSVLISKHDLKIKYILRLVWVKCKHPTTSVRAWYPVSINIQQTQTQQHVHVGTHADTHAQTLQQTEMWNTKQRQTSGNKPTCSCRTCTCLSVYPSVCLSAGGGEDPDGGQDWRGGGGGRVQLRVPGCEVSATGDNQITYLYFIMIQIVIKTPQRSTEHHHSRLISAIQFWRVTSRHSAPTGWTGSCMRKHLEPFESNRSGCVVPETEASLMYVFPR